MKKSFIIFISFLICFVSTDVFAEQKDIQSQAEDILSAQKQYKGAKKIKIVIADLDQEDKKCGFNENSLRTAAEFPITTGTKLNVVIEGNLLFHIHVIGLGLLKTNSEMHTHCAASWRVSIMHFQPVRISYGASVFALILLDSGSGLFKGSNDYVVSSVIKSIEEQAKKFAIQWTKDNR